MAINLFDAYLQNSNGDVLTLTGREDKWKITSITGLNPPQAQVNTATVAGMDGALFNSSKLNTRNIVITLYLVGDIEANRQEVYFYARTKERCTFYFANNNRDVYIDGYIDNVECNLFNNGQMMQISIICPYPYFKALSEIVDNISKMQAAFTFPFSINYDDPVIFSFFDESYVGTIINDSDSECGLIIEMMFNAAVSSIMISNAEIDDEYMVLTYAFQDDDVVRVNTTKGEKSITLTRDGETINIFSALEKGSTFFQLKQGVNYFTFSTDSGSNDTDVIVKLIHNTVYRGV